MDKNYWENYYEGATFESKPSPFALFFMQEYDPKGSFIELGCGNGRDSLFFALNGLDVLGVDQCSNAIGKLNILDNTNANFIAEDFTRLAKGKKYDIIYTRFTLHSVDKESADRTLAWASENIEESGLLAIEVRSVLDELYGKGEMIAPDTWYTDHARRFVRLSEIKDVLEKLDLNIVHEEESKGLAVYKDEDPTVIRLICKKN